MSGEFQAQEEAQRVFADVLMRAGESERIRAKLALLKQYDSLFRLPPRIRDATKRGDYEQLGEAAAQVISDYRTAKALMPDMNQTAGGGVWQNLVQEVEKSRRKPAMSPRRHGASKALAQNASLLLAAAVPCQKLQAHRRIVLVKLTTGLFHDDPLLVRPMSDRFKDENIDFFIVCIHDSSRLISTNVTLMFFSPYKKPRLGLAEAAEAISALLQLQADGAHSVHSSDPVALFIATLSTAAHQAFAGCLAQHQQRVLDASGLVSEDALKDTRWRQQQSSRVRSFPRSFPHPPPPPSVVRPVAASTVSFRCIFPAGSVWLCSAPAASLWAEAPP
ncbi:hypothetical protein MMC07_006809 [Pseudocyphellaria aurata]|nr:hypothetical protein [Pseudocyphellaria aurata]